MCITPIWFRRFIAARHVAIPGWHSAAKPLLNGPGSRAGDDTGRKVVPLGAAAGYRIARLAPTPASHPPSRRCPAFATSLSSFPGAPAAPLSGFDRINLLAFTFNSFPYRVIFSHGPLPRFAAHAALLRTRALTLSPPDQ